MLSSNFVWEQKMDIVKQNGSRKMIINWIALVKVKTDLEINQHMDEFFDERLNYFTTKI